MEKKNVVILGAGFGGLRAAMDIAKKLSALKLLDKYQVTLIDRNNCHIFMPLLYKVAASPGAEHQDACSYDIADLIKDMPIDFIQAEITLMDVPAGNITLGNDRVIHADYLILALGSETNYFGITGLEEHALELKTMDTALRIRAAVSVAFEKGGDLGIVIGGGGPNGVELASELRLWANKAQKQDPTLHVTVSIVEAMPTILPGFDADVIDLAMKRLKRLNVPVLAGMKIASVSDHNMMIDGTASAIPFDILVWTGGAKTPGLVTAVPLQKEPRGKPVAQHGMELLTGTADLKLAPMVYAVGDNVFFMNAKTQKPVPAVAHAAINEGIVAAHNVVEEIKKTENAHYVSQPQIYAPGALTYAYVIPVGERWAAAKIGPLILSGWLGWEMGRFIELNYLKDIMPFGKALKEWLRM